MFLLLAVHVFCQWAWRSRCAKNFYRFLLTCSVQVSRALWASIGPESFRYVNTFLHVLFLWWAGRSIPVNEEFKTRRWSRDKRNADPTCSRSFKYVAAQAAPGPVSSLFLRYSTIQTQFDVKMVEKIYIARHGTLRFLSVNRPTLVFIRLMKQASDWIGLVLHGEEDSLYPRTHLISSLCRESKTGLPRDPPLAAFGEVNVLYSRSSEDQPRIHRNGRSQVIYLETSGRTGTIFPYATWRRSPNSYLLIALLYVRKKFLCRNIEIWRPVTDVIQIGACRHLDL